MTAVTIVGASLAGLSTGRALRREGFTGQVTIVGDEVHPPYDRPPLSKDFLLGQCVEDDLSLAMPDEDLGIDWVLGRRAIGLDPVAGRVSVEDGSEIVADSVVIATGSRARSVPWLRPLRGVHTLRSLDDARALRADLVPGRRLVIVGAGFIGSEIASAAVTRGLDVTVLEAQEQPLVGPLGVDAAAVVASLHARHGVNLRCSAAVTALQGETSVAGVALSDGALLPADVVLVGVGSQANVEWLAGSGLTVDGGVCCDATGWTGVGSTYAVGDCSAWHDEAAGRHHRIEHWTDSRDRAGRVARHIVGRPDQTPLPPPYFWSDQYGVRLQFAGRRRGDEEFVVDSGSIEDLDLLGLYLRGGEPVAVLGMNRVRDVARWRRRLLTQTDSQKGSA